MKKYACLFSLALVFGHLVFGQSYGQMGTPYVADYLNSSSQSAQLWNSNGTVASEDSGGLGITSTAGAAFISSVAVPDGSSQYHVSVQTNSEAGATYVLYLEASVNALLNITGASSGSFYAFAIQPYAPQGGGCAAQVTLYKTVSGTVSQVASTTMTCANFYTAISAPDGSLRLAAVGSFPLGAADWTPDVPQFYETLVWKDSGTPLTGKGGFGAAAASNGAEAFVYQASLSPIDRVAPSSISVSGVKTYVLSTEVDIQAGGVADNAQGVGIYQYLWYRDNQSIASTFAPEYVDKTVTAGSTHTYGVAATDYDGNTAAITSFSVTTPTSAAISPREIGVRPTGSYWGGMGEQIDVRSGNLNYAYPLVTTISRGSSLPLGLAYNSQNWRLDPNGGTWNLGADVGYGFGWQLQFGSITPYASSTWNIAFYEFRDASGATYRLDQQNGFLWTSKDSTYVTYDAEKAVLHFNDGSSWLMDDISAGFEPDAGTLYPTEIEDSNGNMLWIDYQAGRSASDPLDSSSRIADIYDSRASNAVLQGTPIQGPPSLYDSISGQPTYSFTYDSNGYLTSIANNVGSGESFTFAYSSPVNLTSPYSQTQFGSVKTLASISNATTGLVTSFSYDPSNDGELTQVTFPYGGHMRWQYGNISYSQATYRGVNTRFLFWDSYAGERTYSLAYTLSSDATVMANTRLVDQNATAGKSWTFDTAPDASQGLVTTYQQYRTTDGTVLRQLNYTWAQDPAGRNYIGRTQDIADPGKSYTATKQTDQTLDQYGNVTQSKLYAFGNLSTPAKTYTNTYLSGPNYTNLFIFNRLLSSTVTDSNNQTLTLATNSYDQGALADTPGAPLLDAYYGTSFLYRGNLTSSTSFGHVVNRQYDITGTMIYTDDGDSSHGLTVTNSSAANYAAPSAITTANSLTTSFAWNPSFAPLSSTGPNGDTTSTAYDVSTGRPTSTTSPYGAVTTYTYSNSAPHVVATVNGQWNKTTFDGLGRPASVATGNGATTVSITDTVYDTCGCTPIGKPYRTSTPYAPGATRYWNSNSYDALGRTLASTAPDGFSTTSYSYAGNTVTVTDPSGKWKQYVTDAYGQLIQVTEQSPNPTTEPNHVTTYTYDLLGHLIQVQMPRTINGQVVTQTRSWVYDVSTQQLSSQTAPENGTTSYTYNGDGTLATVTDAKNQRKIYSYDLYGRVSQIARGTVTNGTFTEDTAQRTTFTYDGANNGFSSNALGRLSQVNYSGPHGMQFAELYSYHDAGAVTAKRLSISGTALGANTANLDAAYTYDALGNVTSIQYPFAQWTNGSMVTAGPQYNYTYDAMNRLNGMTGSGNQTLVSSVTYGPANQMLQLNASTFTETATYNANVQLTDLVSGAYHFKYNYSATQNNGRVTSIQDVSSGETMTYQYDTLNRLINASGTGDAQGAWSQAFQYDGFGNLTGKTGSNAPNNAFLGVNSLTNRLNSGGAQYDSNGNLTAYGTGSSAAIYAYDIENRLSTAIPSAGANQILFGYDGTNQRVYQGNYNTSTHAYSNEQIYFYGVDGKKLACWSLSSSGGNVTLTAVQSNIWFAGRLLAPQDRLQSQGKYFPYGEDRNSPAPANPTNDREKFATYTRDGATGLDYAYQRYYSSQLGRFHSVDPFDGSPHFGVPQSWNRYGFVANDPVDNIDSTGAACDPGYICFSATGYAYLGGGGGASGGGDGYGGKSQPWDILQISKQQYVLSIATAAIDKARSVALTALANAQCTAALGAKSPQAAQAILKGATIQYGNLGLFMVTATANTLQLTTPRPPFATSQGNVITINQSLNFANPDLTIGHITGTNTVTVFPMAAAFSTFLNVPSMSINQFDALILLHEVEHMLGAPQETLANSKAYNYNIWNNCLKGIK